MSALTDRLKVVFGGGWHVNSDAIMDQLETEFGAGALNGEDAAQGALVELKGGTSSTTGNAGGASKVTGGTPGATGVGGAATVAAAAGGSTSGAGGVASLTGGAGTAGNSAGGAATHAGGAGQGTGAGGAASLVGGVSGLGTSGNGGAALVAGGAASSTNGNGGDVVLTGGALAGTGKAGSLYHRGKLIRTQTVPAAKTATAAITAAELVAGLITTTGVTAPSVHQLPTGTLIDAELPGMAVDDAFDFHLINTGTGASDDATITVNTNVTIVGNPTVGALTDATIIAGSGHFRARKTAANTYVVYRLA